MKCYVEYWLSLLLQECQTADLKNLYHNQTTAIQLILQLLCDMYVSLSVRGAAEPGAAAGLSPAAGAQAPRVLEEWEVPYKYRRALITEEEIEYINVSCRIISSNMYMHLKYIGCPWVTMGIRFYNML